ncbi:MAG TPA: DUF3887 domain-containing protein [Acinetobacter lwoffii]|uniref:DUF3887 domain-containing protein n=1 Tax=Acinetobacter lwoffii TaxID=28090 RepID=A0A9D2UQT8_ACILW|nr:MULTISPECIES: DUF4878 domain-containing protein [unclassified Acinetobacter]MDM1781488.1 DUF3887 domain-containing protein [Acinetobacter indicus]QKQ70541.1 DUF3887 domain-containing protein [Acinetobacter sp. 10FS3-1]TQR71356.1 DUF3887 domain-containing protein [Acinetobacter sp. RF14B]HJF27045.1 DUF3887 domain-containing protein [Acinetobacter lwoffii]
MKTRLMLLATLIGLHGCTQEEIPNPSPAQEQAAEAAYNDLREGKYDKFLTYLEPQLQAEFKDNQKLMKRFSRTIPQEAYKSKTLMSKRIEEEKGVTQYKISYEIAYPKNLVQYDVSFDQPHGSSKIRNFNIQVFGE